ncbi:glycoside hydrolase family 113 [Actinomadura alba]|nr:hypothetical protein [Actinomadura alba]
MPHLVVGDQSKKADPASTSPTNTQPTGRGVRVDRIWKPGMPQWGVQTYWEENRKQSNAYIERKAGELADYLIGLHANAVSISFPLYTGGITSTTISRGAKTPSPQRMARVLQVFNDAGLRTTIRPIMDEKSLNPPRGWRGSIEPASRGAWFVSYSRFLAPYLQMAQKSKVTTVVVGTELNSMEGDPHWKSLVSKAGKIYSGEIAYDANWDNYVAGHVNMPVDHLGVDAYFPIKVPDTASVNTLVAGWNTWLDKKKRGPLPKIVLSEAGIGAMNGAYHAPGDFYTRRAVNPNVQANWYTAICRIVQQRKMSGVYWWSIYFDDDPNTPPDDRAASRLDFAGRPRSEKAIRTCFTSDYPGPGTHND